MTCKICNSAGVESTIIMQKSEERVIGVKSGYFDPCGVYIKPKKEVMIFTEYKCSQGHKFTFSSRQPSQEVETPV